MSPYLLRAMLMWLAMLPVIAVAQDTASAASAVLQRFAGSWETQTRIRKEGAPAQEVLTRGEGIGQPTLDGRYVEFRTHSIPAGRSDLQVMTYDVEAGVYRQWLFDSEGYRHEAQGHWDPRGAILRWQGKTADSAFVIEDRWVSPDRLEWTLQRTDVAGRTRQRIDGTLIRRKE
ncbi:DUF1579 family protein [Candidatus Thiodictyon syntrophicum]|jgi:hypothetical protein|nr:DUF1579 family protein [Candidatus Thiodictyon syntrophicum]